MKNKILIILIIFMAILAGITYIVYNYRINLQETQKINQEFKSYSEAQMLGTELVSIMNRVQDLNSKNNIAKDNNNIYIENEENSIKLYIELKYKDNYSKIEVEKILNDGIENFIKSYSTASFKCTQITFHEKTGNVKTLTFTETDD